MRRGGGLIHRDRARGGPAAAMRGDQGGRRRDDPDAGHAGRGPRDPARPGRGRGIGRDVGIRDDVAAARGPGPPGALGEQPGRRVVVAEQRGHQGPGRRPAGRVRGQAGRHRVAQRLGQAGHVWAPRGEQDRLGPGEQVGRRGRLAVGRRGAEADDPRPLRAEHHMIGPEIPVHQPGLVDRGEPGGRADGQRGQHRPFQRPFGGHGLGQGRPLDELTDQEGQFAVEPGVQDPGGAERGHPAGHRGLRAEPVPRSRVRGRGPREQGDRDRGPVREAGQEGPSRIRGVQAVRDPAGQPVTADPPGIIGPQ